MLRLLRLWAALLLLIVPGLASAGGAVQQLGPVTSGNPPVWWSNGQVTDSSAFPNWLSSYLDKTFGSSAGSMLCRGSSTWGAITPGTANQFLTAQANACPTWSIPAASAIVSNNAGLGLLATSAAPAVTRQGFAAAGDAPLLVYTPSNSACSLNGGIGDGGSQVRSADGKCWLAAFPPSGMDVREFGAKVDGATDDSSAINTAIAAAALNGLAVIAPQGVSAVAGTILVNTRNITIRGCGGGGYPDGRTSFIQASACSRWKYVGLSGQPLVRFTSIAGSAALMGGGLSGIMLDCNDLASYCLELRSWSYAQFNDILATHAVSAGFHLTEMTGIASGSFCDTEQNTLSNIKYITGTQDLTNTARGIWLEGGQCVSPDLGNSNANYFYNVVAETNSPNPAIELDGADDNTFWQVTATFVGGVGPTSPALVLGAHEQDRSGADVCAVFNAFYFTSSVYTELMAGQAGGCSSQQNQFYGYSKAGGDPDIITQAPAGGSLKPVYAVSYTDGHINTQGSPPVISACGSGAALDSRASDSRGSVTVGSGSITACTITFSRSWGTAPYCTLTPTDAGAQSAGILVQGISATALAIASATSMGSHTFNYACQD